MMSAIFGVCWLVVAIITVIYIITFSSTSYSKNEVSLGAKSMRKRRMAVLWGGIQKTAPFTLSNLRDNLLLPNDAVLFCLCNRQSFLSRDTDVVLNEKNDFVRSIEDEFRTALKDRLGGFWYIDELKEYPKLLNRVREEQSVRVNGTHSFDQYLLADMLAKLFTDHCNKTGEQYEIVFRHRADIYLPKPVSVLKNVSLPLKPGRVYIERHHLYNEGRKHVIKDYWACDPATHKLLCSSFLKNLGKYTLKRKPGMKPDSYDRLPETQLAQHLLHDSRFESYSLPTSTRAHNFISSKIILANAIRLLKPESYRKATDALRSNLEVIFLKECTNDAELVMPISDFVEREACN